MKTPSPTAISALLVAVMSLPGCPPGELAIDPPADPGGPAIDAETAAALEEAFEDDLADLSATGLVAAVVIGDEIAWTGTFGTRAPADDSPVTRETLFRLGSVTKTITAIALMQQVDAGLVDLDAPVADVVEGFTLDADPGCAAEITTRTLLQHTSGLADLGEATGPVHGHDDPDERLGNYFTGDHVAYNGCNTRPGELWNYSNLGYGLAGLVAERADGRPYRTLIAEDVLQPLGMDTAVFLGSEVVDHGDYTWGVHGVISYGPDSYDSAVLRPGTQAWGSLDDLAALARFLLAGDPAVLADERREDLMRPARGTDRYADLEHYATGLWAFDGVATLDGGGEPRWHDVRAVYAHGSWFGWGALIALLPDQDVAVATLANGAAEIPRDAVARALALVADLPDPVAEPDLSVDPDTYGEYAGTYVEAAMHGHPERAFTVTAVDDRLFFDMPWLGLADLELVPLAPDSFYAVVLGVPATITFVRDDNGDIRWFREQYIVGERS